MKLDFLADTNPYIENYQLASSMMLPGEQSD